MDSKLFSLLSKQRKKAFSEKKRPFTSGIEVVDVVACTFLFFFGMPLREQGAKKKIKPNIMNLLRPLSPHRPIVQICVRYLFLATIVLFFYLLCLKLERMDWFQTLFDRVGGSLGGKALSFPLRGWGCSCSAGLALTVGFALQALLTGEGFTNMMAPSGGSVTTWKEDTHEIDVLLESFSGTEDTGSSVNQPVGPPVPPANPVASPGEEAGPSNPVRPFPYHDDDLIGGDSVRAIEQRFVERLKAKKPSPSLEDYRLARIQAEDQFEVQVDIIQAMAALDPRGDWMGRGALALKNSRTATGEESLEKLYSLLGDLQKDGVQSATYSQLKGKVFLRMDPDEHSSA